MTKIEIAGHRLKLKAKTFRTGSKGFKGKGTIRLKKRYYHAFLTLVARNSVNVETSVTKWVKPKVPVEIDNSPL